MRQREVSLRSIARLMSNALPLTRARRIVVKVGSALLVDQAAGRSTGPGSSTLVEDLLRLRARRQEVVLVSSGAIALGRRELKLPGGPLALPQSQAAAAVGQIALAHIYKELFAAAGVTVAQILLTLEDSEHRRRYLNARATLSELLDLGALPVINENDTVATTEIRYGDNDRLAARVAQMTSADCLLLLSDVAGLYTADPNRDPDGAVDSRGARNHARRSRPWAAAPPRRWVRAAWPPRSPRRRSPRLPAAPWRSPPARRCTRCGGSRKAPTAAGSCPRRIPENARKQWIAGSLRPSGAVTIDAGALQALRSGKSLLPAGVVAVSGRFARGDTVSVLDRDGNEIARGMIAYSDRRCRAHRRQTQRRYRGVAGVSRPRRDHPPRRSGHDARRSRRPPEEVHA